MTLSISLHILQVIAFVDALLNCEESGVKNVLILSPVNAIHNWINEFHQWIPLMECDYGVGVCLSVKMYFSLSD